MAAPDYQALDHPALDCQALDRLDPDHPALDYRALDRLDPDHLAPACSGRARGWSPSALDVRSPASVTLSATPLVRRILWVRW
ncbi:hypothetical protein GCM10029978_081470 [Actinoallomurus acanthiterrae]